MAVPLDAGYVTKQTSYLLVFSNEEGLSWVLRNSRMAFTQGNATRAGKLRPGDRLFLYTSRLCFRNQHRDRGRVIAEAEVKGALRKRSQIVVIAGREFTHDCQWS